MKRLFALFALALLVFCGSTAAVPGHAPLRVTRLAATLHRTAATNWLVASWTFPDDGKGPLDSAYVSINHSPIGATTHQLPGAVTSDSFDVGLVPAGTTSTWVIQVWGKRSGSLGPKSAPDTASFTAPGGPPPAPTITGVTVH